MLYTLRGAGYGAYFVGGCVRDSLLGRRVHDWDAATSAPPQAVQALFERTAPTGLRHGTVTVISGGRALEVTTFRTEGAYSDHRRPDSVRFTGDLAADLSRRDFTINAMAMGPEGDVTDLFGGRADLQRRLIRCVGEPERRFSEDALRMLRALRFSAQLGFDIDPRTDAAVTALAPTAAALSAERVRDEFLRALASPRPQRAWEMLTRGLLARFAAAEGEAPPLAALPVYARLAHLCFELERRGSSPPRRASSRNCASRARRCARPCAPPPSSAPAAGTTSGCCATAARAPCSPPIPKAARCGAYCAAASAGTSPIWPWTGTRCAPSASRAGRWVRRSPGRWTTSSTTPPPTGRTHCSASSEGR